MMKKNYFRGGAALMIAAVLGLSSCQQEPDFTTATDAVDASGQSAIVNDKYIVVLKKDLVNGRIDLSGDYDQRTAAVKSHVLSLFKNARLSEDMLYQVYGSTVFGFAASLDQATLARLQKDPNVAYIEQDRIVQFAPPWAGGGGGSTGEETPYGIKRVNGGATYTGNGVAWVIDSGVDLDHADLNVDVARSKTFITSGKDARSADDGNGHGTHVAGTIAAIGGNGIGVVGVAAGATVVGVKVLNSQGSGSYSGVIAGVDYVGATGKAGDVANMSLGGPASQALDDAIKAASSSIKFVLAAGNDGANAANYSPARVNGTNIYTISAIDINDRFASFSNWGNPPVDYAAPGVSIKSTWKDGGYNTISGTSMAAPHAAGVLLWGAPRNGGSALNDPDGNPDTIIVR